MAKEKISILIIDDEEMIVDEFLFFLEQFGYGVQGLTDSKVAVEKLKKEKFDIVITDLKMPDVSGMDIARTIKQYSPETLTFIITGFATVDSVIEAIQQGVYDYIRKPFKFKEIKIGIERAVNQILLRRENRILNSKIQQMLSYVTTLYDISSILYQITDIGMVLEMIIDTITEGLNIPKSAIFMKQGNIDQYKIQKSHSLSDEFIENCVLSSTSIINDRTISDTYPTIIDNFKGHIILDDQKVEITEDIDNFILTPIKFHNKILGYLAIFTHSEDSLPLEDELKLLNIIATQAAPIFQKKFSLKSDESENIKKISPITENVIEQYITETEKVNSTVSFFVGRIEKVNESDEASTINSIHTNLNNIINTELEEKIIILWENYDSFLLIIPNSNPATSEILISGIKHKFEKLTTLKEDKPVFTFHYTGTSYPYEKGSPQQILETLHNRLFTELNQIEE